MRLRLDLAYDGAAYCGWARQPGQQSVQGCVEEAFATLLRASAPTVRAAGRTDAGVHARGQVAHVDVPAEVAVDPLLLRRLNGLLPFDIRVRQVQLAPPGFDARFSALRRRYTYRVCDRLSDLDPVRRGHVLFWPRALDEGLLQQAGSQLLGERDFAAYCRRREGASTVRTLLSLDWRRGEDGVLVLSVEADAFCHSMVRSLVGAMLEVGDGRRPTTWPASLLGSGSRADEVRVAPPHALVLEEVTYPPDDQLLTRQATTRQVRP
ncbi:MAG TPA: tRNA pseudouridine(38-40) synthase TruA [Mycobacteriales bacterium]|nr:tRNA pseudouridine(38-40) synthase TruA [Mycobacteriales bacterium]